MLNLTKPLASLDVESTGTDPAKDKIITLDIVKLCTDGSRAHRDWKFNPGCPIPKGASDVHGITDEMVKDWPLFSSSAALSIVTFLHGCDLAGFNLFKFDVPILIEEIARTDGTSAAGVEFPAKDALIVDAGNIFKKKEPRTLEAAVAKYCGYEHESAHDSKADADETLNVLLGQVALYGDLREMPLADLAKFSQMDGMVDYAGKLGRDADGDIIYNIGKARGAKVKNDPGFGFWMLDRDFPIDTLRHLRAELERTGNL